MPTILKFRRGTTSQLNAITGAEGELFVDTTKDTVVVHDGVTPGGKPLATEAYVNTAVQNVSVDLTGYATESYVGTQIANLVDSAPATLDTLNEIAAALNDDANFASTITTSLSGKQETLVSGTNIKTINGTSLLGSGDITISGGSSLTDTDDLTEGSTNLYYTDARVGSYLSANSYATLDNVNQGLASKQETLVSGTNIKTINGTSLLGSGDINVASYNQSLNTYDQVNFGGLTTPTIHVHQVTLTNGAGTQGQVVTTDNGFTQWTSLATINGQALTNGGNITISGGTSGGSLDFGTFTSPAGFTLDMGTFI